MSFREDYGIRPDPNTVQTAGSEGAGWTTLHVAGFRHTGVAEPFDTVATPFQKFSLIDNSRLELATLSNGRWSMAVRRAGSIGLTPPGATKKLRWRALDGSFDTVQLYVPISTFLSAADEYRRVGSKHRTTSLSESGLSDPLIARLVGTIASAAAEGAPEVYGQTATHFLAMYVLRLQSASSAGGDERKAGTISASRLAHVIAFMQANFVQALSLDRLAREAGVSPHHFSHLFKTVTGISPHRFLMKTRLEAATSLLLTTDKSVLEVALACGYYATSHFSEAFRRNYGKTPTQFRAEREV